MAIKPGECVEIDCHGMRYAERPETVTTPGEVERLRARVAKLEAMLRRVQYGGYDWCPICDESPHAPGCELAALLREETSDAN